METKTTQMPGEPISVAESIPKILATLKKSEIKQPIDFEKREKEQEHYSIFISLFHSSELPRRHINTKFIHGDGWSDKLLELESKLGSGLLCALIGSRGTGKTQMACELIKTNSHEYRTSLYRKTVELFMAVRATYSGEKNEQHAIGYFLRPDLLVLDEAHERGESAWEDRLLTYVIDKRYDAMKDTILISNFGKAEFISSVGSSIASRIQEVGGIVICDWKSFRS